MKMTYSPDGDTLDVELVRGGSSAETREIAPDVYVDFDREGRLLAIEILGASGWYPRAVLEELASPVTWLSLKKAAAQAKLSPTTLRVQIRNGRLKAKKEGTDWLVAEHELWNYLENRAPTGRPGDAARVQRPRARPAKRPA